jgi:hypothetical protein
VCLTTPNGYSNGNFNDIARRVNFVLFGFLSAWYPNFQQLDNFVSRRSSYLFQIRYFYPLAIKAPRFHSSFVGCHREHGQFPALPGNPTRPFRERRMSVFCHWSRSGGPLCFTMVILRDSDRVTCDDGEESGDFFTKWEDRRFTVRGSNAGYHLLESVIYGMLTIWERGWSACLDGLGKGVTTRVRRTNKSA